LNDKFGPTVDGIQLPEHITLPPEIITLLPWMKLAELKCTLAAIAKFMRVGDSEAMTTSEFEQMTGLARASVVDGLKHAIRRGILQRHEITGYRGHVSYVYSMRVFIGSKIEPIERVVKESLVYESSSTLLTERTTNTKDSDSGNDREKIAAQLAELGVKQRPISEIGTHPEISRYIAAYRDALDCGIARSAGWLVQAVKQEWDLDRIEADIASHRDDKPEGSSYPGLPEKIRVMIQLVGWANDLSFVQEHYASNPDLVEAWLYRILVDNPDRPVLEFRGGLKSGLFPKPVAEELLPAIDQRIRVAMARDSKAEQSEPITPEKPPEPNPEPESDAEPSDAERVWYQARKLLNVPPKTYNEHIAPLQVISLNGDNTLVLQAETGEECEWLAARLSSTANNILSGLLGGAVQVRFITGEETG
jgi:hypothetical protein